MRSFLAFTTGVMLLLASAIGANAETKIIRVSDNAPVEFSKFVEDIARADVTFIGDTHDDQQLHAKQLEIIRALYAKNPKLAIGLEMFTQDSQRYLDEWTRGKVEEKEFIAIYGKNWSFDWRLYRDIFMFARDNHIPMIALNVPKPIISKVVREGAKALSESERKELPPKATWSLNPRQVQYLRRIREQVFGNRPARFPSADFDEAQALRNDTMAYNVARFREKSPGSTVVVIAGTWHAIKNGVPESLAKYQKVTSRVVLPHLVEFSWLMTPSTEDVDYLIRE